MSGDSHFTIEEIISIPRLSSPAISADGGQVAWVETAADWDKNEYVPRLFIYNRGTGDANSLATGERPAAPAWSVGGRLAWLCAVGDGEGKFNQVFVLDGGVPIQATHSPFGVTSFCWSPAGDGIYFLAPDQQRREQLKERKEKYGELEFYLLDYTWSSLYYQGLDPGLKRGREAGQPKDQRPEIPPASHLAGKDGQHILKFALSPTRNEIALLTAPTPNPEDGAQTSLFLLDLTSKEYREIQTPGPPNEYGTLLFSPAGDRICYTRAIGAGKRVLDITTLEMLELATGLTNQPLLELDECIYPLSWTAKGLVFQWQDKTEWRLATLTPEGITPFPTPPHSITMEAAVSEDGAHWATLTATQDKPYEIYINGAAITQQTARYQAKALSKKEVVTWQSADGTTIEGILITPSKKPAGPSPLLILVHGGPTWAAFATPTDDRYYPYEQFVARGFILLDVNYRGSSGYGSRFRRLNFRNLGLGDYEDVIAGVDILVKQGLADNDRVGVMGWSQGGYISAMCATYSRRFKAVSVGAGISSWFTYYSNTDITYFTRNYLDNTPWGDPGIYALTSPITYIHEACTPTLIQHGDRDGRVPYANAMELYRGLKDMGVPVYLVTFKGMGHGANKPRWHRGIMAQNYAWFCHHLLGDALDSEWPWR